MSLLPWEQTTLGGPSRILQLTDSPEGVCVCVCVCVCACLVMSNPLQPHGLQPARLPCPWAFPYWEIPSPGDLPDPRIEAVSLALASRFFTTSANHNVFNSLIN